MYSLILLFCSATSCDGVSSKNTTRYDTLAACQLELATNQRVYTQEIIDLGGTGFYITGCHLEAVVTS